MRLSLLLLLIAASGCAPRATVAPEADSGFGFTVAYDHTAIHVADLGRSIAFYQRIFGLEEIAAPGDPTAIRWLALGGDDQLHLINYDGDVPATDKAVHLAVVVSDLDAFVAHVEAEGVAYSDWPGAPATVSVRGDGVRQVYVQDPDSYWIEVNNARY